MLQGNPPAQPLQQRGAQLQEAVLGHHTQQGFVVQVPAGKDLSAAREGNKRRVKTVEGGPVREQSSRCRLVKICK